MLFARETYDGEAMNAERKPRRRRMRDEEVLADRDLWMVEQSARGKSQDYIGRHLRVDRSLVSRRVALVPAVIRERIKDLVPRHPDGIPASIMDRLRSGLLEYRRAQRDPRPWEHRPVA